MRRPSAPASSPASTTVLRFLDLPPELRHRVYEVAIGGNVIHVGIPAECGRGHQMKIVVCAAPIHEVDIFASSDLEAKIYRSEKQDLHTRHSTCFHEDCPKLCLNLLLACKKVHAESSAAPFSSNTFAFASPGMLSGFAALAGNHSFHDIRHLLIYSTNFPRYWAEHRLQALLLNPSNFRNYCQESTPQRPIADLPFGHLQNVDVFLELVPADFMADQGNILNEVHAQDRELRRLKGLRNFRPRHVRVIVNDDVTPGSFDSDWDKRMAAQRMASRVDRMAWAERVKLMVTGAGDGKCA